MKNLIYCFLIAALPIFTFSCKKDAVQLSDRDKFVGSYTGTMTTMLDADGEIIDYDIVPITEIIEKGVDDDEIVIAKGTELEINTTVDGTIFLIPGYIKQLKVGNDGFAFDITLLGQGILSQEKELTITSSGTTKYEDTVFKWTIIEKLTKDPISKP